MTARLISTLQIEEDVSVGTKGLWAIRIFLMLVGVALIVAPLVDPDHLHIESKVGADGKATEYDTALATAVIAAGAILLLAGTLFSRISKIGLPGGASLEFTAALTDAKAATADSVPTEGGKGSDDDRAATNLLDLRFKLERKLAWIAKEFIGADGQPVGFLTPGSLEYDGYLTKAQARTVVRLLSYSSDSVASATDLKPFIDEADKFVGRIRVSALFERAYKLARDLGSVHGWAVRVRGRGRPNARIIVTAGKERSLTIMAVFPYMEAGAQRITDAESRLASGDLIAVPRTRVEREDITGRLRTASRRSVGVVYLDQLEAALIARLAG
jgi:hypothetical protein